MKRDLHFCWPRAERAIYYEPKNLVAHGLANSSSENTGGRKRTVYSITPAGRLAFERWLEEPVVAPPQWESEAIVRASFGHRGSKDALLHVIAAMSEHAAAMRRQVEGQAREYQQTGGPFPEHLHVVILTGKFLFDYIALLERWSAWADEQVRQWPSTKSAAEVPLAFAFKALEELAQTTPKRSGAKGSNAPRKA